ncbi:1-acyl-sn-glycerol-3-phosphate acyltransferase [Agrococcus sp. HG114]|uniref:lysophospholipid acyltransferase family protein n=1 Tax=Agrococcus sp. HG114 TaxID=2969757 RepID=UPI00215B2793|nr:lysophospholipid acyltransferase family protein [Agrococcus sp. HG114]MCR8671372.1 1-acyl-sn-glycerol-3-phosphate acyltransferase [Agrococcus sp. HG114]
MGLPGHPPRSERRPVYLGLAALVLPAVAGMAKLRIRGHEHLPATGAFVLSPNHYSEIDPVIMAVAVWKAGRVPRFLAKASLFDIPVIGGILRAAGQIPVERAGRSTGAQPLEAARTLVRDGLGVIIYPEGSLTREPDLWPMRGKTGAVRMALEAGVPLIPAAHWGTQHLMPRYGKAIHPFPRKRIDILFGPPVDLSDFEGRTDQASMLAATERVMEAIAGLLGELRGERPPAVRYDPSHYGQAETGRFDERREPAERSGDPEPGDAGDSGSGSADG